MQVENNKIYNFFFHHLSDSHSTGMKVLSSVAVGTLTLLTGFLYLIPFVVLNLRDRNIRPIPPSPQTTKITVVKDNSFPKNGPKTETKSTLEGTFRKTLSDVESQTNLTPIDRVKTVLPLQLELFEKWEKANQWENINKAHFDWWMFPIDRGSQGKGALYTMSKADIEELKKDTQFMENYRKGVVVVVRSWGWDLLQGKPVEGKTDAQIFTRDVRLGKMANSLKLFGEKDYHDKLNIFVNGAERDEGRKTVELDRAESWVSDALSWNK